jgi:hypothetical protein
MNKMINLAFKVISFICCKILRHEASGFTSSLKEGVQQIFITVTNPSPQLVLMASTAAPLVQSRMCNKY